MDLCTKLLNEAEFPPNTVFITANQRLTVYLQYHLKSCARCKSKTYFVQPFGNWLEDSWKKIHPEIKILGNLEEQLLWQQLIQATPHLHLLRDDLTAQAVQEAWKLIQHWKISLRALAENQAAEEATYLLSWIKSWQALAEKKNWITRAELITRLIPPIKNKHLALAAHYLFVGFDESFPALNDLIQAMQTCAKVKIPRTEFFNGEVKTLSCQTEEEEIYTAARWAKQQQQKNPHYHIACIAPDLDIKRSKLLRIFHEVFENKTAYLDNHNADFSFSLGKPLMDYPLIQQAFLLLRSAHYVMSLQDCHRLLRSPFIAGATQEIIPRAALTQALYNLNEPQLLTQSLLALSYEKETEHFCPQFAAQFESFLFFHKQAKEFQTCEAWAQHINLLFEKLGWLKDLTLTSVEYQVNQRWLEVLKEFANLTPHYGELNFSTTQHILMRLCQQIIFQPQGNEATPIQILGVLEASGMQFDCVWLMGMSEQNWPPAPSTNPFIPFALQKQYGIPAANPEQHLHFYQKVTARLCQSGKEVIASYATKVGEHSFALSPLLKNKACMTHEQLELAEHQPYVKRIWKTQALEKLPDTIAPKLDANEKLNGGSGILKQQAACPFSAFAKYRLAAEPLTLPSKGLAARERGSLIHVVLENIWNTIKDKDTLDKLNDNELNHTIEDAVESALAEFIKRKPLTFKKRFLSIEKQRLATLAKSWLTEEKHRANFKILHREIALQIKLNGKLLHIRVDRIDELDDGSVIILDYKTGAQNYSFTDWLGTRPDDPQLPLYCLATPKPIAGVAFAQVNPKKIKFNGITLEENLLPKVKAFNKINSDKLPASWQTLMSDWKITLEKLMDDFCEGVAKVSPKNSVDTCRYCELKPVCRFKNEGQYVESH